MIRGCKIPYSYLQMHSQILKLSSSVYGNKDDVWCIDKKS